MEYRFWAWTNQDFGDKSDYLLAVDDSLHFRGSMPRHKVEDLNKLLVESGPQAALEQSGRKKLGYALRVISLGNVRAVEYVPLLTDHIVRIRYLSDKGKEQTLRMKLSPDDGIASRLFEELRAYVAPSSKVEEEQASIWTSIRGPVFSLLFGGGWLFLAAYIATTDARAWQEDYSFVHALVGWLIRNIGPFWLMVLGAVWVSVSGLLLAYRLKKPPTIQVWRTS